MTDDSKVVVVTGGGKGIGADITRAFYRAGYGVVVGSQTDSGLVAELGERARFVAADVRSLDDHRKLVRAARKMGVLSAYVNNAGFSGWRSLDRVDEDFWATMVDTNLKGFYWGCKAAAEALAPGGVIVNVSSLAGKRGSANNSVYCATKFGVNGITQALAKELGPKGIRINAVCPVYVRTEGVLKALEDPQSPAGGVPVEQYLDGFLQANTALGRLPEGEDIGELCLFLASQRASAITGQCINIDCGVMPQ